MRKIRRALRLVLRASFVFVFCFTWAFSIWPEHFQNFLLGPEDAQAASWYNSAWNYRMQLSIDAGKVAGAATSFPVLINRTQGNWKHTDFGGHVGSATGWDFVITADDGATKLDHEIEKFVSSTGEFVAWVRIPYLSSTSNTVLYVYYGNAAAQDQSNKTGVWDSNYVGVWHLPNGTALTTNDSTANGWNGTTNNASPGAARIDGGASFDGSTQYIQTANFNLNGSSVTFGGWFHSTNFNQSGMLICKETLNTDWSMYFDSSAQGLHLRGAGGINEVVVSFPSSNTWHYIVGTITGTTGTIYIDGAQAGTATVSAIANTVTDLNFGKFGAGSYFYNGLMDEVRVSNTTRSASWIQTEYNNQSSPSTFETFGAEQWSLQSGAQAYVREHLLNNASLSATSNHTLRFTAPSDVVSWGPTATESVIITLDPDFNLSGLTCGDVDLEIAGAATSIAVNTDRNNNTNCPGTASSWGLSIVGNALSFFSPGTAYTWVATGTDIVIRIGANATFQDQGVHWVRNPAVAKLATSFLSGTFGGYGTFLAPVLPGVQFSATVAETLTFQISGLPGKVFSGSDKMTGCTADGITDDEDGRLVSTVTTTDIAVPFGTLGGLAYQGCQRLTLKTNAGNGYTVYSREDHPLLTTGGFIMDDTTCAGACNTPTSAGSYSGVSTGLGVSCVNSATSVSCSTATPNWSSGANFAPVSAETKALSPAKWSGLSSVTTALVLAKAKYRLRAPTGQAAGDYTNMVSWIVVPVY